VHHFLTDCKNEWKNVKLLYKGSEYPVKLVAANDKADLILVEAEGLHGVSFLRLSTKLPVLGSVVHAIGQRNPDHVIMEQGFLLEHSYHKLKTAKVLGLRSSISGYSGMSGGPLVDASGRVIGIHKCMSNIFPDTFDSVAVPSNELSAWLKKLSYTEGREGFS